MFSFTKWYFDAQTEEGDFLFSYLAPFSLLGAKTLELVLCWFPREGGEVRRCFHLPHAALGVEDEGRIAHFGAGELDVGEVRCSFSFRMGDAGLRLNYTRLDPPFVPPDDGELLRMGKRRLTWRVPMPRASLTGHIRVGQLDREFSGFGYHDLVHTDIPPWRIPLRELLWGRAIGPGGTVIWNQPRFKLKEEEHTVSYGWFRAGDDPGTLFSAVKFDAAKSQEHEPTGNRYPDEMSVRFTEGEETRVAQLTGTRLLLGDYVANVQQFRNRFERWMYRKFAGDPVEYKLLSRLTTAEINGPLWAAHEKVLWATNK